MIKTFDIIIIGGGPGGYVAAIRAASLKKKVAIIEEKQLGGICLNWGCIPTKSLLKTAEIHRTIKNAESFGLKKINPKINWNKIIQRSRNISNKLCDGIKYLLNKNNITIFKGRGLLKETKEKQHIVQVENKTIELLSSKKIIFATGAIAKQIKNLKYDKNKIWNAFESMIPYKKPKSLIIIGSGAIGIEFASFFIEMGTNITIIEIQDRILPLEDEEISKIAEKSFLKQGIKILTNTKINDIKIYKKYVQVNTISNNINKKNIKADNILVAIGIMGNIKNLGLEKNNIKTEENFIKINHFSQTNIPGVYAIGDVSGIPCLAHKATHQGIIAVEHAFNTNNSYTINNNNIPNCTYSYPQIASIGLTEIAAEKRGYKVKIGRFSTVGNGKALAIGESRSGLVKVIFNSDNGELLGAHMIGPEVTEQIQGFILARTLESTEKEIIQTIFPHPTLSEMMYEATLEAFEKNLHV